MHPGRVLAQESLQSLAALARVELLDGFGVVVTYTRRTCPLALLLRLGHVGT